MTQEAYFGIDEMFISVTDKKGIILSGNDVFVRVSGYSREKIIGSPHNLIRHPDMPKTVFRLLWKTIESDKIMAAYVKNRAADGKYYWVLAIVVPTERGYVSMRIKPSSSVFDLVPALYAKILSHEKAHGMDSAEALMLEQLKVLGFDSYDAFMKEILFIEMQSRDQKLANHQGEAKTAVEKNRPILKEMLTVAAQSNRNSNELFLNFKNFNELQDQFKGVSSGILRTCEQLENLSLNMSVMANKLGKEGPSLTMVAMAFQKATREISTRFQKFGDAVTKIEVASKEMRFSVCVSRVLIEMIHFYIKETLVNADQHLVMMSFMKDFIILLNGVRATLFGVQAAQATGLQELKDFIQITSNLRDLVLSLDLIRMGGKLEGARTAQTETVFVPYVNQIVSHIQAIEEPIIKVSQIAEQFLAIYENVKENLAEVGTQTVVLEMIRFREYHLISELDRTA